jgi:hypothetical protein
VSRRALLEPNHPPPARTTEHCQRCDKRRGLEQPEDGDAAKLFEAGAHVQPPVYLCRLCVHVLESIALRVAGVRSWQAQKRRDGTPCECGSGLPRLDGCCPKCFITKPEHP